MDRVVGCDMNYLCSGSTCLSCGVKMRISWLVPIQERVVLNREGSITLLFGGLIPRHILNVLSATDIVEDF